MQLVFFKLATNPHNLGVDIFNCSVIKDRLIHPACRVYLFSHYTLPDMSLWLPIWDPTPGGHTCLSCDNPQAQTSKLIATRRQSNGTVWPGNIKPSDSIREAMRELGQRCSNIVIASMIMAQDRGSTVSLPSANCYLYSLSHNYRVSTTGLYSPILPPLITNWIIRA